VIILPRQGVEPVIAFLKKLTIADERATLSVGSGESQVVSRCDWDHLTLDPSIVNLLKNDFETFFERESWFRKMGLPFRRGYLLHGMPGNGKSSAIRAMLSSRGLSGFTMRFFGQQADDEDLERLFTRAAENAPSMIILEDIDRVFPRTGGSKSQISLQQLLNCLDGIGSGDGVITCATANEPSVLDPAILKRPGRFDRVVLFPNPTPDLRLKYFSRIDACFTGEALQTLVAETEGMSFAQLREVHIMAGQEAFLEGREITLNDLLDSVWKLRHTVLFASLKTQSTGFARQAAGRSKHERHQAQAEAG
jgi:SpoVK/Ycf46/Vps4 family AAA+-type ATPase